MFSNSKTITLLKNLLLGSLVALAMGVLFGACKDARGDGEAVAKVGSHEITLKQVDSAIKQQMDQNGGGPSFTPPELVAARLTVLENLIQEEALFQKAQKDNLVPDDNKVNQEVQKRKQDANLTEDEYQKQIQSAGLSESEVREKIKRELAITAIRDREKTRISAPADNEIEKYYNDHKAEFVADPGVDFSIIVTDPANNGLADDAIGEAQAEAKAKSIYEQLKTGADFATVAQSRSEDPQSTVRGGNVGFATLAQLRQSFPTRPEMPQRLMSMSPGQYTEPIKDNATSRWYIFKVNAKNETQRNLGLSDVRTNIVNTITQQRQQVLLNALMLVAVSEASVKNYLAERIFANPQVIVQMQPSPLIEQATKPNKPQAQPQPRFENQNQSAKPAGGAGGASSANANKSRGNKN